MTLLYALYLAGVSVLATLCASLLARVLLPRGRATRWVWLMAMAISVLAPLAAWFLPAPPVALRPPPAAYVDPAALPAPAAAATSARWLDLADASVATATQPQWDTQALRAWAAMTLAVLLWIATTRGLVAWRRRRWPERELLGERVLMPADFGPAVVGTIAPRVVVPHWVRTLGATQQRLILAHELAHLRARDPLLLDAALLIVAAAPWNPLLWWQLRELRLAIEFDCDQRVLAAGASPVDYASTLLDCSLQRCAPFAVTTAMAEPASTLERRIEAMTSPRLKGWSLAASLCLIGAAATAIAATTLPTPPAAAAKPDLQAYSGTYAFSPVTLLHIDVVDGHLSAAYGKTAGSALVAGKADEFAMQGVDARYSFDRNKSGAITRVVLHQNGVDTPAPRLAPEQVESIQRGISAHIASQKPAPGSEKALLHMIEGLAAGKPDYAAMSPQLAGGTRAMLSDLHKSMQALGKVATVDFRGVNPDGWDEFIVGHEHGKSTWQLVLDDRGVIVGAYVHEGA